MNLAGRLYNPLWIAVISRSPRYPVESVNTINGLRDRGWLSGSWKPYMNVATLRMIAEMTLNSP